ncbi:MAG: hypothetical protein CVT73_00070 [Alphaproteobacteria bacterium HGW-Alphaproteobacteria-12]|nr:MAG: hypothetical protein CVT73_00070 [Alphaproteobacteria bacterium HGW-Alphaproteobacteria-12]
MIREDKKQISFPIIRLHQPIGEFYIGAISARDLCEISFFDIRKIETENTKDRSFETYLGIQRKLSPKRVKELQQYVLTSDANFPTSVIIAVEEVCAKVSGLGENSATGSMTLSNYPDPDDEADRILFRGVAKVIDGQHRIEGLKSLPDGHDFEINIAVFVGADIADQAAIFSTVNLAQTKVNRSLVYDLFSYARTRSPEKTCHEIVVALDSSKGSPFEGKIKRLGVATDGRFGETLSQATVVDGILKYISDNRIADREIGRKGRKWPTVGHGEARRLIFRQLFVEERDTDIAKIVWNYFDAVRRRWPNAWVRTGEGFILNRTNGFNGFIRFLRQAYLSQTTSHEVVSSDDFFKLFQRVKLTDEDFRSDRFLPGTSGATAIYHLLVDDTGLE